MNGVIATVSVKPEKAAEFEAIFRELMPKVKTNEPGTLLYQLTQSRAEPNTYKCLELYQDQAALDHHSNAEYFVAALGRIAPCVERTPSVDFLDALE